MYLNKYHNSQHWYPKIYYFTHFFSSIPFHYLLALYMLIPKFILHSYQKKKGVIILPFCSSWIIVNCQDPTSVNVGGAVTLNVSLISEDEGIFSGGVRSNRRENLRWILLINCRHVVRFGAFDSYQILIFLHQNL